MAVSQVRHPGPRNAYFLPRLGCGDECLVFGHDLDMQRAIVVRYVHVVDQPFVRVAQVEAKGDVAVFGVRDVVADGAGHRYAGVQDLQALGGVHALHRVSHSATPGIQHPRALSDGLGQPYRSQRRLQEVVGDFPGAVFPHERGSVLHGNVGLAQVYPESKPYLREIAVDRLVAHLVDVDGEGDAGRLQPVQHTLGVVQRHFLARLLGQVGVSGIQVVVVDLLERRPHNLERLCFHKGR